MSAIVLTPEIVILLVDAATRILIELTPKVVEYIGTITDPEELAALEAVDLLLKEGSFTEELDKIKSAKEAKEKELGLID